MAEQIPMADKFRSLATQAESGELMIRNDVAERLALRMDQHIDKLYEFRRRTSGLVRKDAFGNAQSAQALGGKFEDLAIGGPGSGSLHDALTQRIEAAQQAADMFRKAGAAYQALDDEQRCRLEQASEQL